MTFMPGIKNRTTQNFICFSDEKVLSLLMFYGSGKVGICVVSLGSFTPCQRSRPFCPKCQNNLSAEARETSVNGEILLLYNRMEFSVLATSDTLLEYMYFVLVKA